MSKLSKFNITLVFVICLLCALFCMNALADEAEIDAGYEEVPVYVDGLLSSRGYLIGENTYVSLEAMCSILGYNPVTSYNQETSILTVDVADIVITVGLEDEYLCANGRYMMLPDGYMEIEGSVVVPAKVIEKIFTVSASWDREERTCNFNTANKAILKSGDEFYNENDLYWMSRVIMWEAGNQVLDGQIGVGNVVLNRCASSRFNDTVKSVIFQPGQFQVVDRGAIYGQPREMSVIAAKLVLEGYNTVEDALFFHVKGYGDPTGNPRFVKTIQDHNFYR